MRMRTIGWLGLGAMLGIAVFLALLAVRGSPLRIVPRSGSPTPTTLRFGTPTLPAAMPAFDRRALDDRAPETRARGVVLVVADGLGFAHLFAARAAVAGPDGRLFVESLPIAGWLTTFADRSLYTDSASAATAMATGAKVPPGSLARDAEARPLVTVLEAAVARGLAAGLITDTYVLDATPAAFVAHAFRRDYATVAEQTAAAGLTLIAGAVVDDRPGAVAGDPFVRALEQDGMDVVRDAAAWARVLAAGGRAAGLFADDRIADPASPPELADLARPALGRLIDGSHGFFLLLETEEVDTGAHRHDVGRVIAGVRTFDALVRLAVERAADAGDVLVIATSDHETGGLGLVGGNHGEPIRVAWASHGHTAEPVPLFAFGPGAERLAGPHDNTEVAHAIAAVLGLDLPRLGHQASPNRKPFPDPQNP